MYKDKTIVVVVPAYNEEKLISRVIETMPEFVDKIVVVDDKSCDRTVEIVRSYQNPSDSDRVILMQHEQNQGVGGAIATGYKWAQDNKMDVAVIMAGDARMDPDDLPKLLDPIVEGKTDYAKGNRLFTGDAWNQIPKIRYLGNSFLSLLTKIASGYWHVADSQTGYAAISLRALKRINIDKIYKRYGMPNDMLVKLNIENFRVTDVPVKPVYRIGEESNIWIAKVVFTMSFLLTRLFLQRLWIKYVIRDFHPLVFFYLLSFLLLPLGVIIGFVVIVLKATISISWVILCAILLIMGFQSAFFAMWFDMDYSKSIKPNIYLQEDES